jgi:hypothetical protein
VLGGRGSVHAAQDLRQLVRCELAGSTRAVTERGETNGVHAPQRTVGGCGGRAWAPDSMYG